MDACIEARKTRYVQIGWEGGGDVVVRRHPVPRRRVAVRTHNNISTVSFENSYGVVRGKIILSE
jgi:hypothetical protein